MIKTLNKEIYTSSEVAKMIDVLPTQITFMIRNKKLKAEKVGRQYFIYKDTVLQLLKERGLI